jgi:D-alanyl-D-alanine endopeptidase (penicillin-binding protein 7)
MNFFSKYNLQILVILAVGVIFIFGQRGLAEKKQVASIESVYIDKTVLSGAENGIITNGAAGKDAGTDPSLKSAQYLPSKIFTEKENNPKLEVDATNVLLADLLSSEKYFEKNSNKRWPIASLSKLMTGYVALRKPNLTDVVTLKKEDIDPNESGIFSEGQRYSVRDLIRVMLISSRNTAANAVANYFGHAEFIAEMNKQAMDWGMSDTHFEDPSGLSVSNQSTASDLLKLAQGITKENSDVWKITENTKVSIKELSSGKVLSSESTNQFASRSDFFGGKTGYIPASDGNLLSVFLYQKRTIVIIVLGSQDRFGETEKIYNWFTNGYRASN